jgi:hypothetical protein
MDKNEIIEYLTKLDDKVSGLQVLYIYGSAVVILLDAPGRTSLDIDVAGPYSSGDQAELERGSQQAGLPVNPPPDYQGCHLEWVGPLRLCLPPPQAGQEGLLLWRGKNVTVRSGNVEDLVASKLIRYDVTDRADVQYLYSRFRFAWESVRESVGRLPHPFRGDAMLLENLSNLETDMRMWVDEV